MIVDQVMPILFKRLRQGLQEGIAHERGPVSLRVTERCSPEPQEAYTPERVRRIRTTFRLSQYSFGRLLQVSRRTVQDWENGTHRPNRSSVRLLQFLEQPDLRVDVSVKRS